MFYITLKPTKTFSDMAYIAMALIRFQNPIAVVMMGCIAKSFHVEHAGALLVFLVFVLIW